jgi:HK97 family phage major capsid protein
MSTLVQDRLKDMATINQELISLVVLENPSARQMKRMADLKSAINAIKAGSSLADVRAFELDQLRKEAGLTKLPDRPRGRMAEEDAQAWRHWAKTGECRATSVPLEREVRANLAGQQSITSTTLVTGTAFIPNGIYENAYEVQKQSDQIFDDQVCHVVETATGNNTAFPVWNDVNSQSVQVGETNVGSEVDVAAFSETQLGTYSFRSGIVAVSIELFEDSNWPVGEVLQRVFSLRHARGGGQALVNGSGFNAPQGLITGAVASGASITVASGSSTNDGAAETGANSIGTQDLAKCYFGLNAAYRPGACWAMNDTTLLGLVELLDRNGRPIISWRKGPTDINSDTPYLMGKPVAICPSFPSIAAGNNSVAFYNPLYFVQRRVPSAAYVQRFKEAQRLIELGLYGFQSYLRFSSALIAGNPQFVPASLIQNHS